MSGTGTDQERGIRGQAQENTAPLGKKQVGRDPTEAPCGSALRPGPVSPGSCRGGLSLRTLRPSAASCALWPTDSSKYRGQGRPRLSRSTFRAVLPRRGACAKERRPRECNPGPGCREPRSWPSHLQGGECEEGDHPLRPRGALRGQLGWRRVTAAFRMRWVPGCTTTSRWRAEGRAPSG